MEVDVMDIHSFCERMNEDEVEEDDGYYYHPDYFPDDSSPDYFPDDDDYFQAGNFFFIVVLDFQEWLLLDDNPPQAEQSYHDVSELWDQYLDLDFFKPLLGALNRLNVHELREMLLENFFYSIVG